MISFSSLTKGCSVFRQPHLSYIWRRCDRKVSVIRSDLSRPSSTLCVESENLRPRPNFVSVHSRLRHRASSARLNYSTNPSSKQDYSSKLGLQHTFLRKEQFAQRCLRSLSTYSPITVPLAASGTAVTKDESREFMAVFPDIVRDLTDAEKSSDSRSAKKWFSKVLQYNVPGGKKNRGLAVVFAFKMLATKEQLTPEHIRQAQVLGWCVELLQAFLLVIDDLMDNAVTRRGRPCWYRHNNLGVAAINDSILLEGGIYTLLKKHFRDEPYYMNIVDLFHEVTMKTSMGQTLDCLASQAGKKPDFKTFTMDRYNAIVKHKTAYYSFHLPVALAMHMTGFKDAEVLRQAKTILLEMGQFFQVQDDFLDCFGDPDVTGKVGTDIEDGKCSWLAVVALQRASPEQKEFFLNNYGSKDAAKVAAIKGLYEQLGLPAMFAVYEEESYHLIVTHIQQLSRGMPHELFFKFLEKIYKRES